MEEPTRFQKMRNSKFMRILTDEELHRKVGRSLMLEGLRVQRRSGKLSKDEYVRLRDTSSRSGFMAELSRSVGAQAAIIAAMKPFFFALGASNAAKGSWVVASRIKALKAYKKSEISKEEYRELKYLHSVQCAVIATIPFSSISAYPLSALYASFRKVKGADRKLIWAMTRGLGRMISNPRTRLRMRSEIQNHFEPGRKRTKEEKRKFWEKITSLLRKK